VSVKRTCSKCGWVFPSTYNKSRCNICGNLLSIQYCPKCKQFLPLSNFSWRSSDKRVLRSYCDECHKRFAIEYRLKYPERSKRYHKNTYIRQNEEVEKRYKEWLSTIKALGKISPLTEEEWHEAVDFFKGCAICGDPHIEIRTLFILTKCGGGYNKTNVFPTCATCGTRKRTQENPFRWLHYRLGNYQHMNLSKRRTERLIGYLKSKIEEVQNERNMGAD
jgi:hypothetical protein